MNRSSQLTRSIRTAGPTALPAPVLPGDRLLLARPAASTSTPTWAVVEVVDWILAEEILRGNAQSRPWRVYYRIAEDVTTDHSSGQVGDQSPEQASDHVGVVDLDDHGHDLDGCVVAIKGQHNS